MFVEQRVLRLVAFTAQRLAELGLTPAQAERNGGMRAGYIVDLLRGDPPVHLELQRAEL